MHFFKTEWNSKPLGSLLHKVQDIDALGPPGKNCQGVTAVLFLSKIDTSLYPAFLFGNISDLGEDIVMPAWISYTITACGGCEKLVASLQQRAKR